MVLDENLEGHHPVVLRNFHADCHEILRDKSADQSDIYFLLHFLNGKRGLAVKY